MAGGEDLAGDGRLEDPAQRRVAGPLELGGDADPVGVHRHRQRGRRGVAGQAALAGGQLGQVEAPAAELGGHGGGEVAEGAQLGQVLVEVGVGPVELAGRQRNRSSMSVGSVVLDRSVVVGMIVVVLMAATMRPPALTALAPAPAA